jgi:AbrB family looped-hinge helix DNA binding protein
MRITSKGQVTIPQAIREQAGLHPGSEVEFQILDGRVVLTPVTRPGSRVREALEHAAGTTNEPAFRGWTTDRIMQFLRGAD